MGVNYCPQPFLPSQYQPPEGPGSNITVVFLQRGTPTQLLDTSTATYDGARDASISTQYSASWNEFQGNTRFYGEPYLHISDVLNNGSYASRHLLRFGGLDLHLSPQAQIAKARLVLSFLNWMWPPVPATLKVRPRGGF